jgi:hypothetical protein
MRIPSAKREAFVADIVGQCFSSLRNRINRGNIYRSYYLNGSDNPNDTATYNKTFAYIDDLESLLYSPVSLRFNIGDPELPNVLQKTKNQAAATHLRALCRRSNTDGVVSEAVTWALVKGKAFAKQTYKSKGFAPDLVQPESLGVFRENHHSLDENMEAFAHRMWITTYQFNRMLEGHPDRDILAKRAKAYMKSARDDPTMASATMQVTTGGPAFSTPGVFRGPSDPANPGKNVVDWLTNSAPEMTSEQVANLLPLDEVWVWDDRRDNWATFWQVSENMMIHGKYQTTNFLSWNTEAQADNEHLKGKHPFVEFCPNPLDGYFWGRSEIRNVALLQEAINSRMNGINELLRRQEDPPMKFTGVSGVNQNAFAKFKRAGGYWSDANPNAKAEALAPQIPEGLYMAIQESERMFDEMGGLPPIAKGRGEAGVRGQGHAETLIRMFSPRFKDRALIIEREVEELGGLMLDLSRAHIAEKLTAWVPQQEAGAEGATNSPLIVPPAPGMVPVRFTYSDIPEDCTLTVDSHSSSPAFAQEEKAMLFDLFKIGAVTAEDVLERSDVTGSDELISGIHRREAQKAAEIAELEKNDPQQALKAIQGGKKK